MRSDGLLQPDRGGRLRRVVLPREAGLAGRLCLVYPRWTIPYHSALCFCPACCWRRCSPGLVAAADLGAAGGDADRLLRGALAAGAGFREHLLHALLAGGRPLAVRGHDRTLRGLCGRGRHAGRGGAGPSAVPSTLCSWLLALGRFGHSQLAAKPDVRRRGDALSHDDRPESRLLAVPQQPRQRSVRPRAGR